jgi:probable rRNA maturation factor
VTDVLSFAARDEKFVDPNQGGDLGEILICLPQARRQVRDYGWNLDQELARLLIHGLAHLLGYEHEDVDPKTAAKMRNFEEKIWRQL